MDFPRHGAATGVDGLRQLLVKVLCDDFLRLRAVYAALRRFFFTLVFFLLVVVLMALGELCLPRATLDLMATALEVCFWVF